MAGEVKALLSCLHTPPRAGVSLFATRPPRLCSRERPLDPQLSLQLASPSRAPVGRNIPGHRRGRSRRAAPCSIPGGPPAGAPAAIGRYVPVASAAIRTALADCPPAHAVAFEWPSDTQTSIGRVLTGQNGSYETRRTARAHFMINNHSASP